MLLVTSMGATLFGAKRCVLRRLFEDICRTSSKGGNFFFGASFSLSLVLPLLLLLLLSAVSTTSRRGVGSRGVRGVSGERGDFGIFGSRKEGSINSNFGVFGVFGVLGVLGVLGVCGVLGERLGGVDVPDGSTMRTVGGCGDGGADVVNEGISSFDISSVGTEVAGAVGTGKRELELDPSSTLLLLLLFVDCCCSLTVTK